jgi:chromosome segregation ATPase
METATKGSKRPSYKDRYIEAQTEIKRLELEIQTLNDEINTYSTITGNLEHEVEETRHALKTLNQKLPKHTTFTDSKVKDKLKGIKYVGGHFYYKNCKYDSVADIPNKE